MVRGLMLSLFLGLAYRFRGGGFVTTGSNTLLRFSWGLSLSLAWLCLNGHDQWPIPLMMVVLAYVTMLVPHGFAQNMGGWSVLQCRWFTKWLLWFSPSEWRRNLQGPDSKGIYTAPWGDSGLEDRVIFDFSQMQIIGAVRGLIVFVPCAAVSYFVYGHTGAFLSAWLAVCAVSLLQAVAYLAGNYTPFGIGSSLVARSATWGEFFDGVAWGVAILLF